MKYRKANEEDCRAVYRLICELEGRQLPFDRFSSIYQKQQASGQHVCLVCEWDDKVVGVLNLRIEEQLHHSGKVAEVMELAVDSACRSRGIGKELLEMACRTAKKLGCVQIEAASSQSRTDAHRFYLREGMVPSHLKLSKTLTDEGNGERTEN